MITSFGSEVVKLANVEFHTGVACISLILWQLLPLGNRTPNKLKNEKAESAWTNAIQEFNKLLLGYLPEFGFDDCKITEAYGRNYVTPYRHGYGIELKKNPQERVNMEKFGTLVENLAETHLPRFYKMFQK